MGYSIFDRASNQRVFFTGAQSTTDYIRKGNSVIPVGMKVKVDDLKPGSYRLVMQAVDSAKNRAPDRTVEFDITERLRSSAAEKMLAHFGVREPCSRFSRSQGDCRWCNHF